MTVVAGVADHADTRTGDMRGMPFHDGEFDAVVSSCAIDHLRRDDLVKGLSEVARVLKPRGEGLTPATLYFLSQKRAD